MASTHDIEAPVARKAVRLDEGPRTGRLAARLSAAIGEIDGLWQRLESDPAMSFHQCSAWVEAWASSGSNPVSIVTLEQDGTPFALLPLEIAQTGGLRIARFAGTGFSNENTGLVDRAAIRSVVPVRPGDLAAALRQAGLHADLVVFDKMTQETAARPPFSALPRVIHQNPSFQLPLSTDFAKVLSQINGKRRRKKFRVSERRLEAIGGYRHLIGEDDATALRLLNVFLAQKPVRLAAQGLPNVFASPRVRAFLTKLATTRTAEGHRALELHGIEILEGEHAGEIVAVAGLTLKHRHVTCQFGSIHETIATDTSAGELLFFRMIERASAAGHAVFDFGVGDQLYKRSWCPCRTELVDCYAPLTLKGRLAAPVIAGAISAKRAIKTSPALHAIAARVRALTVKKPAAAQDAD